MFSSEKSKLLDFVPYKPSIEIPNIEPNSRLLEQLLNSTVVSEPIDIHNLILNLHVKFKHSALDEFVEELQQSKDFMVANDQAVSILHLYALRSTSKPIDMSHQEVRTIYRPDLFIRQNDTFGRWNFNHLLNLLELDYQRPEEDGQFPKVWRTTLKTKVKIVKIEPSPVQTTDKTGQSTPLDNDATLLKLLQSVCRQNQWDEKQANNWRKNLENVNIGTIERLHAIVAKETVWEKIDGLNPVVKLMIREYVQLNSTSDPFNQAVESHPKSKAALLGDIHRVRRYFYSVTGHDYHLSDLDRKVVQLAIEEIGQAYEDDGNVLKNIQNYLRKFCLRNKKVSEEDFQKQQEEWNNELKKLETSTKKLQEETTKLNNRCNDMKTALDTIELTYTRISKEGRDVEKKVQELSDEASALYKANPNDSEWQKKHMSALEEKAKYNKEKSQADEARRTARSEYTNAINAYLELAPKLASEQKQIDDLKAMLKLDLGEEHKKLKVKFGRGLLLYGPPGTGKSELLKIVAEYTGITMLTAPLAAGELNRPYVGETEKLLIDIMNRARTIPHLICAMTIDEIDGLVPKRDSHAQQSKVDGISVLLSHIEGVKNIPNLIVFGATNRRNMMDDAFLRRMQAKCFVGRPSPQIRRNMLQPLLSEYWRKFTNEQLDFLVKITTNFSGAAVNALKTNIIITLGESSSLLSDHTLIEHADNAAREFSCWFGIETLPEICRLYPNMFYSMQKHDQIDKYSLNLPEMSPSGRILVDLEVKKCLIELSNAPSFERPLDEKETSIMPLLARFVHGCSSRNIDIIQIIDMNFLTKHNAFDENQIFEVLNTVCLECHEYNRSMLIFDIDSLIMLNINDSTTYQSFSISNTRLYQFIRERCKQAGIEKKSDGDETFIPKERWIGIIVKHSLLRNRIIEDIAFKKSVQQIEQENLDKEKQCEEETEKICPKCHQDYIPSKANYGTCRYHDGFIYYTDQKRVVSNDEAQIILQAAKSSQQRSSSDQLPKLIWACCLQPYDSAFRCRTGICGLPQGLQIEHSEAVDQLKEVEKYFMNNSKAKAKIEQFMKTYQQQKSTSDMTTTQ